MNEVITKLDDIETRAGAIMSDAKARKEELMRQLEQDKHELDMEYEQMEKESIERLKSQRLSDASGQIIKLEQDNHAAIKKLDALYEERGDKMAEEIFQRIIKSVS